MNGSTSTLDKGVTVSSQKDAFSQGGEDQNSPSLESEYLTNGLHSENKKQGRLRPEEVGRGWGPGKGREALKRPAATLPAFVRGQI